MSKSLVPPNLSFLYHIDIRVVFFMSQASCELSNKIIHTHPHSIMPGEEYVISERGLVLLKLSFSN